MGSERFRAKTPGTAAFLGGSFFCVVGLLLTFSQHVCEAFNLDVENPAVYGGPKGSYFGYAVDFYLSDSARWVYSTLTLLQLSKSLWNPIGKRRKWYLCMCAYFHPGSLGRKPHVVARSVQTFHWTKLEVLAKLQNIYSSLVKVTEQVSNRNTFQTHFFCGLCLRLLRLCVYIHTYWAPRTHALRTARSPSACAQVAIIE